MTQSSGRRSQLVNAASVGIEAPLSKEQQKEQDYTLQHRQYREETCAASLGRRLELSHVHHGRDVIITRTPAPSHSGTRAHTLAKFLRGELRCRVVVLLTPLERTQFAFQLTRQS